MSATTPREDGKQQTASPGRTNARRKVLYVEDDKDWRELVVGALRDAEYEVLAARDATEAMLLAEGVRLSAIILDLNLDGEDGLVLMRFFKRNQLDVPIILFTGLNHDDDAILEMLRQGAHQYVRKGPLDALLNAVRGAIASSTPAPEAG